MTLLLAACDCGGGTDDGGPTGARLTVTPRIVDFGRVTLGRSARVALELRNDGSTIVQISRARATEALAPEIRVDAVPAALLAAESAMVDVVFTPDHVGTRAGELFFDLADETVSVPIVASVVDPALVVRPMAVDFGQVVVGKIATATVTVTNEGAGAVKISALTLDQNTSRRVRGSAGREPEPRGRRVVRLRDSLRARRPRDRGRGPHRHRGRRGPA